MKKGKMRKSKLLQLFIVVALAFSMIFTIPFTSASAAWLEESLDNAGMYDIPYTSLEEALVPARAKHEEVVNEGTTLLKNNGILPLATAQTENPKITVFNSVDALNLGLEGVGFDINVLSTSDGSSSSAGGSGDGSSVGSEGSTNPGLVTSLTPEMEESIAAYNDAAIVRIYRVAGEANDVSTGRSYTSSQGKLLDRQFGDITWINEEGEIVEWNQEDYEDGKLREAWPDGTPKGWNHKHLTPNEPLALYSTTEALEDRDVTPVRHGLMLSLKEEQMIQLAKANFDNVIIVYDSITQFELYDLQNDPEIDAIVHSGRMTNTSINNSSLWAGRGVARVLSGQVNPSAYLISQWDKDMTADPTWQNFGDNFQNDSSTVYQYSDGTTTGSHTRASVGGGTGIHGVDYEEGIYLGYKYYETYWHETAMGNTAVSVEPGAWSEANQAAADAWHKATVNYPFGYGLSYADFDYEIVGVDLVGDDTEVVDGGNIDGALFASTADEAAKVETINVSVKVTNTSSFYGGKAAPQIYVTAPYIDGEVEKSFVSLVGFDKTRHLNPGQSEVLTIPVQVQDMASFDYDGRSSADVAGYILDEGEYTLRVMNSSSMLRAQELGMYDEVSVTVQNGGKAINLIQDDYSGNVVEPLFSTPGTREYTIRDTSIMAEGGTGMTVLSRSDMDGTFPKAPTYKDLRLDDNYIDDYIRSETSYVAGYVRDRADTGVTTAASAYSVPAAGADVWYYDAEKGPYSYQDDESDPWYISRDEFDTLAAGWDQVAQSVRDADTTGAGAAVKLNAMSGKRLYMEDGTVNPEWTSFMNQLTYLELQIIASCGNTRLARIDAIGKNRSLAADNTSVLASIYHWGDQPLLSRTWNLDLAADHGKITAQYAPFGKTAPTGWWSPGCNLHRSPFSGRNGDYYGQDAFQAGMIISAVTKAAEEHGLACWIKHFVLNDQETNRNGLGLFTWGTEQTFRENYFPYPQKAFQEGEAQGNMQSFARIGGVVFAYSYEANTAMMRYQWGWTGTSVTDMLAGMRMYDFTVPAAPANWWDAATTYEGDVIQRNATRTMDTTKNWIGGRTATNDQMVRGAQGLPDATQATQSIFQNGAYVNNINSWNSETNKFVNTGCTVANTTTVTAQTNNNPVGGIWSEALEGGKGGVYLEHETGAAEATTMTTTGYHQWYYVRTTAMYCCYEAANSRGNQNGMLVNDQSNQLRNYHNSTYDVDGLTQGTAVEDLSVAIEDATFDNTVTYAVVGGELPAGLMLNASTGAITGTPTVATTENTVVTVQCRVATYLYGDKTVTFAPIASVIEVSDTEATAGLEFSAEVESDLDATYTVSGLPAGLAYADGEISGTAKYPGSYDVTIVAKEGNKSYTSVVTIDVATPIGLTQAQVDALIAAAEADDLTQAQVSALIAAAEADDLTQAQVTALINAAIEDKLEADDVNALIAAAVSDFITEDQVDDLIEAAINGVITEADVEDIVEAAEADDLTEDDVDELIAAAIEAHKNEGCGSMVTLGGVLIALAALALAFVVVRAVRAKKD